MLRVYLSLILAYILLQFTNIYTHTIHYTVLYRIIRHLYILKCNHREIKVHFKICEGMFQTRDDIVQIIVPIGLDKRDFNQTLNFEINS